MIAYEMKLLVTTLWSCGGTHFCVTFFRCVKNSMQPSPVMSLQPKLLRFIPPKLNGSRGTGTPMFTPSMAAENRFKKYSECCPTLV